MTRTSSRWIGVLAAVGVLAALRAVFAFVLAVSRNEIPWNDGMEKRAFYLRIGEAYGDGFVVGFFLAFSLSVLAFVVSSAIERRSRARNERAGAAPARVTHASARGRGPDAGILEAEVADRVAAGS